ncbi:MAG: VCBS repeat-containing protein [Deltaproteobacteria bacterium]|nr:VCBS repeat-containing protein [Deltaproteobacteria bacterium]
MKRTLCLALGGASLIAAAPFLSDSSSRPGELSLAVPEAHADLASPTCPATSAPKSYTGTLLDTSTTKNGVVFNNTASRLELGKAGSTFTSTQLGSNGTVMYAAVGDFNNDGWPDFVGASENNSSGDYLQIFRNFTWQNENCTTAACTAYSGPAPNWADPTVVITPKFTAGLNLHTKYITTTTAVTYTGRYSLAAADFNGDGWDDIFEGVAPSSSSYAITTLNMYLNAKANDASGNATFQARYSAASGFTPSSVMGQQLWSVGNTIAVDYNKDGRMDVLIATGASGGSVRILLNSCPGTMQANGVVLCSSNPVFTDGGNLIANLNTGNSGFGTNVSGGTPAIAYADIDGDGLRDLVVGAPNCCSQANYRLRIFKGCSGGSSCTAGLENTASQSVNFVGGATDVFIADFSLDGKPDLLVATDNFNYNPGNGGATYMWENNGTSTPFSGTPAVLTTHTATNTDFDIGFIFDYDRDPAHTPDVMIADGNDAAKYYVLANRVSVKYVQCGDAASGVIDLGSLTNQELVVTAARITPTFALNGGTIAFYMSNEEPPNWVQASLCAGSTTDYCVSFPKAVGSSVRWKAYMCSSSTRTQTPTLSNVVAKFDYTQAKEHYRGGIVVSDGLAYVGAFKQPGDRGKFYAMNANMTTVCDQSRGNAVCWEAATKLDSQSDGARNIYTAVGTTRVDFTTANASNASLRSLLKAADTTSASSLISWVRGKRFGLNTTQVPTTRLGSIETSTPAVLTPPGRPSWYSYLTPLDRMRVDAFIAAKATRPKLVLFGSKDGMVHAVRTVPENITDARNGREEWAFIPPTVAANMLVDQSATAAANASSTTGVNVAKIASYPDGSPTLADVHVGNGVYKTVALIAEGNGGRGLTALDVTDTVDAATGAVSGPQPMWSATPGDGEAGYAFARPVVARVQINGAERYLAIAGTGTDFADQLDQKGRILVAYDLLTGAALWKFQTKCPLTSDIVVFETDSSAETGSPKIDGYADRVVFADKCGYVYKVAPNVDLGGAYQQNTGMGAILANTTSTGQKQYALFSTKLTSGALGADRPIAGTIGARTDASKRMVLFFGTGGLENVATTLTNHFYGVYADTGAIRSRIVGGCNASGNCEKFYGGVVVTTDQVIFTRTIDPVIGSGSCDLGKTTVQAVKLDDATGSFVTDFSNGVSSAVMGALYGDAGAIYFATLQGDVARIGTPRAGTAGADTSAGRAQGMGAGDPASGSTVGTTAPFTLLGWRVVL